MGQKWITANISGGRYSIVIFQSWESLKSFTLHLGDELFFTVLTHRWNVEIFSLHYRYFNTKSYEKLHSIIQPVKTIAIDTHHEIYTKERIY